MNKFEIEYIKNSSHKFRIVEIKGTSRIYSENIFRIKYCASDTHAPIYNNFIIRPNYYYTTSDDNPTIIYTNNIKAYKSLKSWLSENAELFYKKVKLINKLSSLIKNYKSIIVAKIMHDEAVPTKLSYGHNALKEAMINCVNNHTGLTKNQVKQLNLSLYYDWSKL